MLRIALAFDAMARGLSAVAAPGGSVRMVWVLALLAILAGLTLLIGLLTPLAGAAATAGYLVLGILRLLTTAGHSDAFMALDLAAISSALVFLGPGAYSLDARLFGRREIVIPRKIPDDRHSSRS